MEIGSRDYLLYQSQNCWVNSCGKKPKQKNDCIAVMKSAPKMDQVAMKISYVNSSGPRTFPLGRDVKTYLISIAETGDTRAALSWLEHL